MPSHPTFEMDDRSKNKKTLTMENLNPRVIEVEYAVRGPIVIRAAEIEKELKTVWIFFLFRLNLCLHVLF